jgi:hypothetical protein
MPRSGLRFFWILIVSGVFFVAVTLHELPGSVATNFGGAGRAHAWMTRGTYAGYLAAIGLLLPLLAVVLVARQGGAGAGQWWLGCLLVGLAVAGPTWGTGASSHVEDDVGVEEHPHRCFSARCAR